MPPVNEMEAKFLRETIDRMNKSGNYDLEVPPVRPDPFKGDSNVIRFPGIYNSVVHLKPENYVISIDQEVKTSFVDSHEIKFDKTSVMVEDIPTVTQGFMNEKQENQFTPQQVARKLASDPVFLRETFAFLVGYGVEVSVPEGEQAKPPPPCVQGGAEEISPEMLKASREVGAIRSRNYRANLSPEQAEQQRSKGAERMRARRASMSPEEADERRAKEAARIAARRAAERKLERS